MTQEAVGGLSNEGFWGMPVQADLQYALSLYILSTQARPLRYKIRDDIRDQGGSYVHTECHCGSAEFCGAAAAEPWSRNFRWAHAGAALV